MRNRFATLLLAFVALAMLLPAQAVYAKDKAKKGGVVGNSYGSQFEQVSDERMRITTRKKVQGTLEEINEPDTSTYKAFQAVTNAALLRAAVEAKGLGFAAMKVSGTRNLSQTSERRSLSSCPGGICEKDFTFAKGTYATDVELAIEVTFDLLKEVPADAAGVINVETTLKQFGM